MAGERRKFERISIPATAKIYVVDDKSNFVGNVNMIGRGGMMVKTEAPVKEGETRKLVIVDESEWIRREVSAYARYNSPTGVGFEFDRLDVDAAVEIGVIIGKYYSAATKQPTK